MPGEHLHLVVPQLIDVYKLRIILMKEWLYLGIYDIYNKNNLNYASAEINYVK